jgi:hypothetical protein
MWKKIYKTFPPLFYFIFLCLDLSIASLIEKKSYSIQGRRDYKADLNVRIVPFKSHLTEQRAYLRDLVYKVLRDRILSYGRIRLSRAILNFERKPFYLMERGGIPAQSKEKQFLELRVLNGEKFTGRGKGLFSDSALESIDRNNADVVLEGEIIQRDERLEIKITVSQRIYGEEFNIVREGSFRGINNLLDEIGSEVMKSIIVDYAYINISTIPDDAALYVDNRYMGRSNRRDIIVESGHHELSIRKDGFEERRMKVFTPSYETRVISVALREKGDKIGKKILVVTHPEKAKVYLDSDFIGYSPVDLSDLYSGIYRLRVEKKGYVTVYRTIRSEDGIPERLEIVLPKGSDEDYYLARTTVYRRLFQLSLIGTAAGLIPWFYFGLRIEDERAKVRGFKYDDPDNPTPEEIIAYDRLKERRDDRINRLEIYRSISLYTTAALLVSAGIFYYLDLMQDDIDIALYYSPGDISVSNSQWPYERCLDANRAGIVVTFRF